MSERRQEMKRIGELVDPVQEMLRRMIAEFGDGCHYHGCPADDDSGPCNCFAGALLEKATLVLNAAVDLPSGGCLSAEDREALDQVYIAHLKREIERLRNPPLPSDQ